MRSSIIFDIGDVLENRDDISNNIPLIQSRVLRKFGIDEIPEKRLCEYRAMLTDLFGERPFENRYFYWRDLLELCGHTPSPREIFHAYDLYLDEYIKCVRIFDDVEPSLERLSQMGYQMSIISNNTLKRSEEFLRKFNIRKYFSDVVVSELVGSPKPYPMIFRYALFRMKLTPEQTAYVGNRVDDDVVGARNLNIYAILLRRTPTQKSERLPKTIPVISTLNDLPLLQALNGRK